ncbi:carbohydrate ABC transporter permease [Lysinibacillus xylanilyticus]|uniref:ABC transporter permease n=1 Tax=Lysinibacillus xylanilyticus TaxID=582475 RepID=A0A2M9Q9Q5_9BACI|nr:carbohydrate ABC transporter permease [Lysinibacillus xylanilyticus]PJO44775.1 ABC transporter permease [Lysinibacillus xylanilyticus]
MSNHKKTPKILKHLFLALSSILFVFPFIWMILSSFKTSSEVLQGGFWPKEFHWENYQEVLGIIPFHTYILNSFYTSLIITIYVLISSALFAYMLAFYKFKGKELTFGVVMATYMIPGAVSYVPVYVMLAKMGMLNTHFGYIISLSVSVFGIFYFRQAFLKVGHEIVEAAKIDGASDWKILWKIIFPMTRSSFVTLGLVTFIENYNNYIWPALVLKDNDKKLITNGIADFFINSSLGRDWSHIMVASTIATVPLLLVFLVLQKWFLSGVSDSGIKG